VTAALVACQPPVELPKQDALSGFEVDVNGFSFPNFGGASETAKLTPSLVARLFGPESVCASPEGACRLTPLANQWMTKVNESMRGGRCEGFAVLSGLFYQGVLSPTDFGANDAFDLNLLNRPQLSQEIAYWFSTQFLRDVVKESTRSLDGRQAVAFLSEQYRKSPVEDLYRVGMVRVGADGKVTGGHAMVATAVLIDEPEKRFRIQVYDNNHPGAARFISVDSVANTWEYEAARTPKDALSLYQGTSANRNLLYLAPLKNRTGQQRCSFCGLQAGDASAALNQIFSFGSVEVAAVDGQGNATGVVQGRFVNTLPGASLAPNFSIEPWEDPMPPIVFVPASGSTGGQSLSFRVTGTGGSDAMHMTMFGAGFSVGVSGDAPPAGASNVVTVSKGGTRVSVTHAPDAGGEFTVSAIAETADGGQTQVEVTLQLDAGYVDTSSVEVNPVTGNATVAAQGDADVQVEVAVVRSSGGDEVVIEGTTTAPAGGSLEFNISGYSADAGVLEVTVDQDGDGTPDMTVPVPNHGPSSPPAAPEGLRALPVAYNRVQLYWRDASRYEARVVVERALGAGSFTQLIELPPDTESYLDTLVVASESYRYRVRATNAYGASPWSTEASVMSPECPTGLQDRDRDGTCENACSVTICDPHATCDDASGQAVCACSSGFSGDGRACADTDECLTNNGGCGDATYFTCTNNVGAGPTCSDINECLTNNGGCGDATYFTCTNNAGAGPTCGDVNECLTNNGGCGDATYFICTNNAGAGPTCSDINECLSNNGGCGDAAYFSCTNNAGAGPTCSDINECLTNNGGCGDATYFTCTNNAGAGPTCSDINECLTNNGGCGDAAYFSCTNNAGAGPTCSDINECLTNNGGCGDATYFSCTNNAGAGPTCSDIDECLTNNGGCGDATYFTCTNNAGAGPTCSDINECLTNNGGCGDATYFTCTNNAGAGPTCSDINECLTSNGGCGDVTYFTCTNNAGAGPTCSDINECLTNNGGCGDATYFTCTNNTGAGPTCSDINECLANNGGCGDATYFTCTNNAGAGPTCSDLNECLTNNGGCGDATYFSCTNNAGAGPTCSDLNECLTNNGGCGDATYFTCTNNAGAGPTCGDLNECLTNNGGCGEATFTLCTNNVGAGPTCSDLNECLTNNGGCGLSTAASCTNRIASPPTCVCLPGRTGSLCATLTEFIVSATNPTTHEALIDMVRDAAGNLYLAVQTDGATAYGGGVSLGARGGNDIALVSFDPAGRARWAVLLGSSAHDGAVKLAIDAADNVFIVGTARGVPFWVSASDSLGVVGGYVASYTSAGVYRWSRSVASDARSIAIGPSGNVTVSGLANGAFDYGLGTQQARGAGDLFLVTYTNDGLATLWARVYGSDPYPYAPDNSFEDMVYDATGNLYASGHLGGPNGNVGGATLPYVGQQTAVLASYTSGGVHRWSKSFAPSGPSYADSAATSIAIDGAGHLATFVRFRDSIDLGGGTLTTPSPGGVGYGGVGVGVLGVFATVDGAFVAQRPFLTGVPTIALDVRYDSAGNVLLAGNASNDGADFGAGPTRRGAFVAGYDAALNYRFSKVAIGGAYPYAQALVVADDGDIYAAGNFDNTTVSWGVGSVVESGIGNDFWLARMHPMLPVVSGLVAHYTAREPSGLTLAGSSVNVWSDLSGSGHPLAPSATSPTWLATGINGRAALDFATGRGLVSGPFPLTTDVTVLVVATWGSSPDTWGSLAHHGSRDNDWSLEQVPTASDTVHFQSQNDNTGVELVCKVGEPTLFVGIVEGNTRTLRLVDSAGDRQVSGAGVSIAAGNKALWVGRSDVGESANALIGEVVYFNRALTPAETNQLVSDLKATWGIAHP
jgi:hypothetical protein